MKNYKLYITSRDTITITATPEQAETLARGVGAITIIEKTKRGE